MCSTGGPCNIEFVPSVCTHFSRRLTLFCVYKSILWALVAAVGVNSMEQQRTQRTKCNANAEAFCLTLCASGCNSHACTRLKDVYTLGACTRASGGQAQVCALLLVSGAGRLRNQAVDLRLADSEHLCVLSNLGDEG